jgi:ribosomal-protein-serine acetyltransferase
MFIHRLTDQAELRALEHSWAEEIFTIVEKNRAYLRPWMGWINSTTNVDHVREWIKRSHEQMARNDGLQAAIFYDGKYVGGCGFVYMQALSRRCEIGYWIDQDHQGKGLVTMAARALVEYAIGTCGMNRVEIRCDPRNERSAAVAKRLGFKLDGVLRENTVISDQVVDMAVWSMLAKEWQKQA